MRGRVIFCLRAIVLIAYGCNSQHYLLTKYCILTKGLANLHNFAIKRCVIGKEKS